MITANRNIPKITYLFRSGRRERLAETSQGPTEFFYGSKQLLARGVNVSILEDSDVGMAPPLPLVSRLANKLSPFLGGLPVGIALSLLTKRGCRKLDGVGCVVATTNGMGMALAIAKAMGQVDVPVLLLAMGLLPMKPSPIQKFFFGVFAKHLHIVCISRSEQRFLQQIFPKQSTSYVPFGVDHEFWTPGDRPTEGYVLAIGNDINRDWTTLIAAWSDEFPPLKIVTSLPVPLGPANVKVIRGSWRNQLLSDYDIRALVRGSRFVVVPLRDTIQPTGQSVCLQAMACGKAVILSDIAGLWDRDLIRDGDSVLLTPPGDVRAMVQCIRRLIADSALVDHIGSVARRMVVESMNVEVMADSLLSLIVSISPDSISESV